MITENYNSLLSEIKAYLHITWKDEDTDRNLMGYIKRGVSRLEKIAGSKLNFMAEELPRQLLFDYVRYANAQALEVFEKNFSSELLSLNIEASLAEAEEAALYGNTNPK